MILNSYSKIITNSTRQFEENPYAIVFMGHGDFHSKMVQVNDLDIDVANLLNSLMTVFPLTSLSLNR